MVDIIGKLYYKHLHQWAIHVAGLRLQTALGYLYYLASQYVVFWKKVLTIDHIGLILKEVDLTR